MFAYVLGFVIMALTGGRLRLFAVFDWLGVVCVWGWFVALICCYWLVWWLYAGFAVCVAGRSLLAVCLIVWCLGWWLILWLLVSLRMSC